MKRANGLLSLVADPDNLRLAFWKAGKGKRHAAAVLRYGADLDNNLLDLQAQVTSGEVVVGRYRYFKVYEPKERQICASAFGEQVLHHALMNVCHPYFERAQIFDSYASRKGKGQYAALGRARSFTGQQPYFLKLDVKKFFDSIHHDVLKQQLGRMFKDGKLLHIFEQIVDSFSASPNRGVPIGNLTSQYFANHYLSGLDHFIKEGLRVRCYVRYMDDMVLWHGDREALKAFRDEISVYVEGRLQCSLKPEILNACKNGLPFLGYQLRPGHTRLLHKSKHRFARKMAAANQNLAQGIWTQHEYQRHVLPLLAFVGHADGKNWLKTRNFDTEGQAP